jgi:hypothetical protein
MTTTFRCLAVTLLLALATLNRPAHATTYSTDYTDLWYNSPAESEAGWGVNIIQQNNILFITMFVYGADGTPRWFVGSNITGTSQTTFTGPIYSTTGTHFGSPWTPSLFTFRQVGTIAFTFNADNTAAMSYNVDSVVVTKNIVRQTWANNVLTGNYIGGASAFGAQCGGSGGIRINGFLTVTHQNPTVSMFVDFTTATGQTARCTYNGNYSQSGHLGTVAGNFACVIGGSNANVGNFVITEINASRNGFDGRFAATDQFCSYAGYFGGIKDAF